MRDGGVTLFMVGNVPDGRFMNQRVCGRFFNVAAGTNARIDNDNSVCSESFMHAYPDSGALLAQL